MSDVIDRAFEIARAYVAQEPKDRMIFDGEQPLTWRVSLDVWQEIRTYAIGYEWALHVRPRPGDRLFGQPIRVDDTLPENSMVLD
jgi:hypothetical protein